MKTKITLMYVALLTMASAAPAVAQVLAEGEVTNQILLCDDVVEVSERLACFNAIVDSLKAAPIVPAAKNPAESVSISEAPVVEPTVESTAAPEIDDFGGEDVASKSASSEAPVVASTAASEIDDFGSEGIASKSTKEEESSVVDNIEATIVRSWKNYDERFSVELDNGQIWRETQGTRVGQPKVGKSVKITKARWGGYRMKVENIKRIAWVRRTK